MDTDENVGQEGEYQGSGDTYITYEIRLEDVEASLSHQEQQLETIAETQSSVLQAVQEVNENAINAVGVVSALFGFLIGFFVFKELLKVWLE